MRAGIALVCVTSTHRDLPAAVLGGVAVEVSVDLLSLQPSLVVHHLVVLLPLQLLAVPLDLVSHS